MRVQIFLEPPTFPDVPNQQRGFSHKEVVNQGSTDHRDHKLVYVLFKLMYNKFIICSVRLGWYTTKSIMNKDTGRANSQRRWLITHH